MKLLTGVLSIALLPKLASAQMIFGEHLGVTNKDKLALIRANENFVHDNDVYDAPSQLSTYQQFKRRRSDKKVNNDNPEQNQ